MTWHPIALLPPQYVNSSGVPYSGAVLKAYTAGTTTNVPLATDTTGGTTAASIALNSSGYPVYSGTVIIPHIDQDYKLALYPTQAAADANSGAIWTVDNIPITSTANMNTSIYDPAGVNEQLVGLNAIQTLTNKTLSSPNITGVILGQRNPLLNSAMSIAQRGTSFTTINGTTPVKTLDGWFGWTDSTASMTISQQSSLALSGFNHALRVQRPNSNTSVNAHRVGQIIETADCHPFAGQSCYLTFYARAGANFSAASSLLKVAVGQGTGTDQGSTAYTGATWTAQTLSIDTTQAITTTLTRYSIPLSIAAGTKEIAVTFGFTPVGTAGTDDYFDITGVQLELQQPTAYAYESFEVALRRCQRRYWKSFFYATAPVQNAGGNTGELLFPATKAAATTNFSQTFLFPTRMRSTAPTITFYNPSASNAQAKDASAGADCTSTATVRNSDCGFSVQTTANASTAVANALTVHATADAEL